MTKDYNLAAFVEEDILEWNTFLANPLQRETSEWPLLQMGEFNEETDSTLSEKDKALLEKYLQKTSKTRQVFISFFLVYTCRTSSKINFFGQNKDNMTILKGTVYDQGVFNIEYQQDPGF